jgi:hypothetical protein
LSPKKRHFSYRPNRSVWAGLALTPVLVILGALLIAAIGGGASATAGSPTMSPEAIAFENRSVSVDLAVRAGKTKAQLAADVTAYWTPARMAAAKSYPERYIFTSAATASAAPQAGSAGYPGGVAGVPPNATGAAAYPQVETFPNAVQVEPEHAAYPPPRDTFEYGPRYRTYPASTVGKVFFIQDHDGNGTYSGFVCSGSSIFVGGSTARHVLTAGHCVNNGRNGAGAGGGWSANFQICPSYDSSQGGVNPAVGCWTAYNLATSGSWISSSNSDRDWGGAAMNNGGVAPPAPIGNRVGQLGRAWNWNDEHFWAFGYPAAAPYTGGKLVANTAEHSYTINQGLGADSKYQGNEMTGGSSGGPWIKNFGYLDGNNWADGVNSHKRCTAAGCPPGSVLLEEMGSPPFTNEAGGSESFFAFLAGL